MPTLERPYQDPLAALGILALTKPTLPRRSFLPFPLPLPPPPLPLPGQPAKTQLLPLNTVRLPLTV